MANFRPRIAIAGAGPGGLVLGQLLHQHGIDVTIYDLRGKATSKELADPSGMLDLHEESGMKAMRECGLWDGFQAAVGDCSEMMRVMNSKGTVLHADEGELESRPEIARNALTTLLIGKIPSEIIKWDHKITSVQSNRNASTGVIEFTLYLGSNGTATYDFIVGADGAWSKIRKLVSDVQPHYSGAQILTAVLRHASGNYPHLLELTGSGTLCALGGCNAMMTQRGPQDSIRLYAAVSTEDVNWVKTMGLEGKTAVEVKTTLLGEDGLFRKWAPALQNLLSTACDETTKDSPGNDADIKPWFMLPIGYRWKHQMGMTLVGDAAHLMTPWAGEGVNLAMWDALDLAHVLAAVPDAVDASAWQAALDPRVRAFEETMWARSQEKAEETDSNRAMFLSENGADKMANFFKQAFSMVEGEGLPREQ